MNELKITAHGLSREDVAELRSLLEQQTDVVSVKERGYATDSLPDGTFHASVHATHLLMQLADAAAGGFGAKIATELTTWVKAKFETHEGKPEVEIKLYGPDDKLITKVNNKS